MGQPDYPDWCYPQVRNKARRQLQEAGAQHVAIGSMEEGKVVYVSALYGAMRYSGRFDTSMKFLNGIDTILNWIEDRKVSNGDPLRDHIGAVPMSGSDGASLGDQTLQGER